MADDEYSAETKARPINKVSSSLPAQPNPELSIAKTATVISSLTSGTQLSSSPSGITSFQLRQHFISTPLGIRLANSAVAVPMQNVPPQRLANPSTNVVTQGNNLQVPKQNLPLVNANAGASQLTFHPRLANPGFSPISTTLIGQPVALQKFQPKGQSMSVQRLPTGSVIPASSPQILRNGSAPGAGKVQLARQVVSPGNMTNLQVPKSLAGSTIMGTNHVGLRVPNHHNQPMTVQRLINPVIAQPGGMAQSQIMSNSTNIVQGTVGTQPNAVSLHGPTPLGATTILTGQQFTIQPRPQGAIIAGAVSSPLTLTVTSISPGSAILSSSSSTMPVLSQPSSSQVQQVQQFIQRPGVVISQPSVLRGGIVLPRAALTLTGNRHQVLQGAVPRIFQRPLVSQTGNCGGQITMHLPSMVGPVIKASTFKPSSGAVTANVSTTTAPIRDNVRQVEKTSFMTATTVSSSLPVSLSEEPMSGISSSTTSSSLFSSPSSNPSSTSVSCSTFSTISQVVPIETSVSCPSITSVSSSSQSLSFLSSPSVPVSSTTSVIPEMTISEKSSEFNVCAVSANATDVNRTELISAIATVRDSLKEENINSSGGLDNEVETPVSVGDKIPTPSPKHMPVSSMSMDMSSISVLPSNLTAHGAKTTTFPPSSEADTEFTMTTENGGNQGTILTQGFIDSNLLEWNDKIGTLPGTDMRFKINEFGVLELVEDQSDPATNLNETNEPAAEENGKGDVKDEEEEEETEEISAVNDPGELSEHEGDPICCCVYCGRYGYKSNFRTSGRFCSQACAGKKNVHRKQTIMSRIVMGMKKGKKKLQSSGDTNVSNGGGDGEDKKNPSFDWDAYLAETGAVAAPKRVFKEPFPASPNGFKLRMRLEGIDPKHQALFCVLSVAEIAGYRLRVHFDGYSECYDFWVNANSPFIFPVGWAEKNGKTLQPPKGISISEFNWTTYLKQMRAVAAPKSLFTNQPALVTPSAFRVNMKLEAVDKKNSALVCVASIADTLGDKILIHFDGWEDVYDYWCDITSPNIHSVGWCKQNRKTLSPPPDHNDTENFTWDRYLTETKTSAVPSRAFKSRTPMGFENGMKLEVTDKRNPILIRVASVKKVKGTRLLIHFDGWDNIYDYWLDDDHPDLHPANWCSKTGHALQIPVDKCTSQKDENNGGCPTKGCKGIGHMKGAKYAGHHSEFGCPYSSTNMSKDTCLADRLGSSRSEESGASVVRHDYHGDIRKCPTPGCNGLGHVTGKFTSHHCVSGCPLAEKNLLKTKQEAGFEPRPVGRPGRGRKRKLFGFNSHGPPTKFIKTEPTENSNGEVNLFHASVHESVFQSEAVYPPRRDQPLCWNDHAKLLPGVQTVDGDAVGTWNVEEVADFIQQLTGQNDQAQRFKEEQIDGDSFLLLQQSDLVNFLNIKLGPAVKIFNSIQVFRSAIENIM